MKKNQSLTQFKGLNISNINLSSPTNKKIQGFDITSKSNFVSKIQTLKNKPNKQSVQDQYINGLQDQIHYLQLELKLLQQKDQAKHGQIDQLQKFFSDGVPINQNILAIKNGFNNYKNAGQKKIIELMNQKNQRENLKQGLKKRIIDLTKDLQKQQKQIRNYQSSKYNQFYSIVKNQARLKKQLQLEDDQLKQLKVQNRKLSQKIGTLQRNKQIQMVMILKNQNHKLDKLSKLRQSIHQKQIQCQQLEKQFDEMMKQQEQKTYVLKIQQQNLNLKKKAISMERQLNSLQTKAQQKQMELDMMLKERHRQICAKTQMKNRVDTEKFKISQENSLKVQDIQKAAKEKQIILLQKIIGQNKKLSKYTQYYNDLLTNVQDQIQKMGQRKPQVKSEINAYQGQVKRLAISLQDQRVRQTDLYADIVQFEAKTQHLKSILPPLMDKSDKSKQQIKIYANQKQKLIQDIKVKQKQLDLVLILKSLNLQQVQISKSSTSHIQDKLINFIRNWQQLQRNN